MTRFEKHFNSETEEKSMEQKNSIKAKQNVLNLTIEPSVVDITEAMEEVIVDYIKETIERYSKHK